MVLIVADGSFALFLLEESRLIELVGCRLIFFVHPTDTVYGWIDRPLEAGLPNPGVIPALPLSLAERDEDAAMAAAFRDGGCWWHLASFFPSGAWPHLMMA
jgi:hypothetical protein